MIKKRWYVGSLTAVLLAIAITGGAVLAQEGETNGDSPLRSFVSRVASILGLEEAQVQDAIDQAAGEMQDEALQSRLDSLVEGGRLNQEEADEQWEWYQSRPDSISPGIPGFAGPGHHGGKMWGGGMRGGRGWIGGGVFHYGGPPALAPESSGDTSSDGSV